jgi:CRISPR-associated protein Cst2
MMTTIMSMAVSARITLDLHSLNNEGTEGNQQQTRMVHIIDAQGNRAVVNAVSGDMMKHILVEHLTPLLVSAGQPVCANAQSLHPDRILLDPEFVKFAKDGKKGNSEILKYMLEHCAVTDLAGTLYAEKAAARKSCVEFGWVTGLPDKTVTEQYFHVKYDPQSREKATGGTSVESRQAIFHRPASSGVYALVCNLDLYRVGLNDVTRRYEVKKSDREARGKALVRALAACLLKPTGAQRNTQAPHLVACQGCVSISSTSLPPPLLSPLTDDYREQIEKTRDVLNGIQPNTVRVKRFEDLAGAAQVLAQLADELEWVRLFSAT